MSDDGLVNSVRERKKFICAVIRRLGLTPYDDLVQEGHMAMLRCINSHDPAKGQFSTYAYPAVAGAVLRERGKHFRHYDIIKLAGPHAPLSVEPDKSSEACEMEDRAAFMRAAMEVLNCRQRTLMTQWLAGDTLQAVGKSAGVSKERARQIIARGLDNIRDAMQQGRVPSCP